MKEKQREMKRELIEDGALLCFEVMDKSTPPKIEDNDGFVIGFVPFQGYQWCKYHNGSNRWQSMITRHTVKVEKWLKLKK